MADEQNLPPRCWRCGEPHEIFACPHVKALEFEDGHVFGGGSSPRVSRIEFLTPADCVARRVDAAGEPQPDYPRKRSL